MKKFDYLIVPLIYVVVMAACGAYVKNAHGVTYASGADYIRHMLVPVLLLAAAAMIYWWRTRDHYVAPLAGRPLGWAWLLLPSIPVAVLFVLAISNKAEFSWPFFALLLFALGVGVGEELIFRGVVIGSLARFGGLGRVVWVSGLIFGLAHGVNIFLGQPAAQTLRQVIATAATGVIFAVFYLYLRKLWPLILLHAAWDYVLLSGAIETGSNWSALLTLVPILELVTALIIWLRHRRKLLAHA